ncbi:hypothetical protein ACS0TY_035390 [Phlomoides rotata]
MVLDVEKAFMSVRDNGEGELSLKLALLWILYGVLLVRGRSSKKIQFQYIHIADNIKEFNQYPWGRVALDFLVKSFRKSMQGRVEIIEKNSIKTSHVDVQGFGYAIQF